MIHHKSNEFTRKIDGDIHLGQIKHVTWYPDSRLSKAVELGESAIELCIYARDGTKLAIHMDQQTLREIHGIAEEFDESLRPLDCEAMICGWVRGAVNDDATNLAGLQLEIEGYWKAIESETT